MQVHKTYIRTSEALYTHFQKILALDCLQEIWQIRKQLLSEGLFVRCTNIKFVVADIMSDPFFPCQNMEIDVSSCFCTQLCLLLNIYYPCWSKNTAPELISLIVFLDSTEMFLSTQNTKKNSTNIPMICFGSIGKYRFREF